MSVIDTSWHPLIDGNPPRWASEWGQDAEGVFAGFSVGTETQIMRWIPSGRFTMGSPDNEPGRFGWEGPPHEVSIARGFWLGDTPVTQSMWQAVMGNNPSRFQDRDRWKCDNRPVEQVSWNDAQAFLAAANERVAGLNLRLPSEAEWEYACRAGTETALWTGSIEILGARNAPALDPIAWYSGNSGVGLDLDEFLDSSNWPEKQYDHSRAGTQPAGLKEVNPWGLADMLGNVWEWCEDHWHDSYDRAPGDGSAWLELDVDASAERVSRGGAWDHLARHVRSACRLHDYPDDRSDYRGFRCARVQDGAEP